MTKNTFDDLKLPHFLLQALKKLGYEAPSPVQAESIPVVMEGRDLIAQAQTGTGKTAAFALPILANIVLKSPHLQGLVLAPTRELAIQVAEAFKSYAKELSGFHVLPIYGGQSYDIQLKGLKRNPHVVVGTPGRIMDHMRRGTLQLEHLKTIVLDEADEMLRMGFIDDVEWILSHLPESHQTLLFSATLPDSIRKVANRYLNHPVKVHVKSKTQTVDTIEQYYTVVSPKYKVETLTRFLEVQDYDATIIFTRTKTMASELAERLQARGYAVAAIHGDLNQAQREKVIQQIKKGTLDIVVATEVAARGLDVARLSFVINYDIPYDAESYTHRIGRTGRAGRTGIALSLVFPREMRILRDIERGIRQPIQEIDLPSANDIQKKRFEVFAHQVAGVLSAQNIEHYRHWIGKIVHQCEYSELDVAAALAFMLQGAPAEEVKPEVDAEEQRPPRKRNGRPQNGSSRKRSSSTVKKQRK